MRNIFFVLTFFFYSACLTAQHASDRVRLNQVGFYPDEKKIAVIVGEVKDEFQIFTANGKQKMFSGKVDGPWQSEFSPKKTFIADFSSFQQEGMFIVFVPGVGYSYPFEIQSHVLEPVVKATLKGFYFIRASTGLTETFAGQWKRPLGHPDNKILIHASAATGTKPEGTVITGTKGWYDAGDYNKYIVNSGITMATLLSAYEDFPGYFNGLETNIPESKNVLPDLLDEVLWNLRWMLQMQDQDDGGVYHKLTNASFDGMIMPHEANSPRYVVEKSTAAALDFAAVMAQASRVLRPYANALPGFTDSCLTASTQAWQWAIKHPDILYNQEQMNAQFKPVISTGAYGDSNVVDEFSWAAAELYITTGDEQYYKEINFNKNEKLSIPSWSNVKLLGYYSLIRSQELLPRSAATMLPIIKQKVLAFCDSLINGYEQRSFMTVIGKSAKDFEWGSNSLAANEGILLIEAFRISRNHKYLTGAISNVDYLLGRNATGYSFITGCGDKTPMHPHHRPSEADGIEAPVPGLLVGGPNPHQQDQCDYPSSLPDESFVDDVCSYASNEIAINWNAPIVYLSGAIEAVKSNQ